MASDKSSSPRMTSPDQSMIIGRSLCDMHSETAVRQTEADRYPAPADASHPVLSMIKETAAPKGQCECHKIDWTGGPGKYKYIENGDPYQQGDLISCQDKINENLMSCDDYESICQFIPGETNSKFPQDVYLKLLSGEY